MKKSLYIAVVICLLAGFCGTVKAQAPYNNSIGVTVGNMQSVSYKTFIGSHFGIQVDLGTKITRGAGRHWEMDIWDLELNPNFMYEGHFTFQSIKKIFLPQHYNLHI